MQKEPQLMDMNIQKYLSFVKTVEYGSFTKATEILNYSQSGISRMIGDLEKDWKVVLLERGKDGVKLTSDGLTLLPYARSLVAEYEKLQMQVDELNGLQSGLIRIGTFSSVATHWLPNIIKEFQKDYPHIDYELLLGDYAEIEEWVIEGGRLRLFKAADTSGLRDDLFGGGQAFGGHSRRSPARRLRKVPHCGAVRRSLYTA